jgi:hypothetical protein
MRKHVAKSASLDVDRKSETAPVGRHFSFFVRCLIEHRGGQWQGFSLEYGLAVQGTSQRDVQRRLERVILSYIHDALVGEDREHADLLLSRRATFAVYCRYYYFRLLSYLRFGSNGSSDHKAYREPLALEPRLCSP